jgi:SAM-dependent methyltransferase
MSKLLSSHRKRIEMIRAWAQHDASVYRAFMKALADLGCTLEDKRILDIGCGANAPMTILLHSAGVKVTGIDDYIGHRWGLGIRFGRYWLYLKEVGFFKTLRKALGEVVYDRQYYKTLGQTIGLTPTETGLDLRRMSATNLSFPDNTFDVIHSNATWEHVGDVKLANRELSRLLRPGGLAYIEIHLFPSLSGGHDLPWIVPGRTDRGDILPWRHLRDPGWTAPVYLNRMRERDYRQSFEETPGLEIIAWTTEFTEGESLLTDQLRDELAAYSREELLTRSIIVILQRKTRN